MRNSRKTLLSLVLGVSSWLTLPAQTPPQAILQIDIENQVRYVYDSADLTAFATLPSASSPLLPTFSTWITVGDIVAVNGQPAKGMYLTRQTAVNLSPTPSPGQAIANTTRTNYVDRTFEIQQADGTPVGSIMLQGLDGGTPPPGSPAAAAARGSSYAIVGGTGAFLGARGQLPGGLASTVAARVTSVREDPSNRRANGTGGKNTYILQLIPLTQPQILAVAHSGDFATVSTSQPAAPGESLSMVADGLGPCQPANSPNGQPTITSPISITLNGNAAKLLGTVCYAGEAGGYQINFEVPPGTPKGAATLQMSAAWIPASPVTLMVQ